MFLKGLLVAATFLSSAVLAENAVWSKRNGLYYTRDANRLPEHVVSTTLQYGNQTHTSPFPDKSDFQFFCPGDSFLVGFSATKVTRPYLDKVFRFVCAFFENSKGETLRVGAMQSVGQDGQPTAGCRTLKKDQYGYPADPDYDFKPYEDGVTKCAEGEAIRGFASKWYLDLDKDDRQSTGFCCHIEDWAGKKLSPIKEACSKTSYAAGDNFDFVCPDNQVITKIETKYVQASQDRNIVLECCPWKLP